MMTSRKTKVYLTLAAVIVAAAVPAGLMSAGASTTACGSPCTSPYNESAGSGEVLTESSGGVKMATASTTSSAQDWTVENEGDVSNAVSAGVISAKFNMLYSTDPVVEYQYAPDGVPSDNCMAENYETYAEDEGLEETTTVPVTMLQCGVNTATLWIVDASNESNGYVDLINANGAGACIEGSCSVTGAFAEPDVLTVSGTTVELEPLSELGSVVSTSQMWADYLATDDSALQKAIDAKAR
jgi:hypothetical protein